MTEPNDEQREPEPTPMQPPDTSAPPRRRYPPMLSWLNNFVRRTIGTASRRPGPRNT